jgi:hypothetical protein
MFVIIDFFSPRRVFGEKAAGFYLLTTGPLASYLFDFKWSYKNFFIRRSQIDLLNSEVDLFGLIA